MIHNGNLYALSSIILLKLFPGYYVSCCSCSCSVMVMFFFCFPYYHHRLEHYIYAFSRETIIHFVYTILDILRSRLCDSLEVFHSMNQYKTKSLKISVISTFVFHLPVCSFIGNSIRIQLFHKWKFDFSVILLSLPTAYNSISLWMQIKWLNLEYTFYFFKKKKNSFFVLFVISIIAATSVSHFICNVNIEDEKTKKRKNYA